jgi:hypothetical protein
MIFNVFLLAGIVIIACVWGLTDIKSNASNEDYITSFDYTGCMTPEGFQQESCVNCFENVSAADAALVVFNETTGCGPTVISYYKNEVYKQVASSGGIEHIAAINYSPCYYYFPCVATWEPPKGSCQLITATLATSCVANDELETYCVSCCERQKETFYVLDLTLENQTEE